ERSQRPAAPRSQSTRRCRKRRPSQSSAARATPRSHAGAHHKRRKNAPPPCSRSHTQRRPPYRQACPNTENFQNPLELNRGPLESSGDARAAEVACDPRAQRLHASAEHSTRGSVDVESAGELLRVLRCLDT